MLHVITGVGPGGAERVLHRYIMATQSDEHIVLSLLPRDMYAARMEALGAEFHTFDFSAGGGVWNAIRTTWRVVRARKPDAIKGWMHHGNLFGGLARVFYPRAILCYGFHSTAFSRREMKWPTYIISRLNAGLSWLLPNGCISCSAVSLREHQKIGYRGGIVRIIPNGVDSHRFRPDPAARTRMRSAFNLGPDDLVLGNVARFHPQKDHDTLFAMLRILKDAGLAAKVVCVGRHMTPENDALMGLIDQHGVRDEVVLLGERGDIADVTQAFDLGVLSSAFGEAFPNVLIEAMACGVPCVTTDVGDTPKIVGHTGEVVPPRRPEALAEAVQRMVALGQVSPSEAVRQRILDNFTMERMAESYRAFFLDLIDRKAPSRDR